ncbi:DMT family transporter, partial [Klebsiella pneumoniae]|nr:DMT family transporter [Klebsiella pneumoniae]
VLAGLLNNGLYLGLSFTGMTQVSSGFTAVIISANPLLTALLAGPVLGERLNRRKALGLVLGFIGVVVVLRSRIGGGHE